MINLLPPQTREGYRYARANQRLLGWIAALVVALVLLAAIAVFGNTMISRTANNYSSQVALSQAALKNSHVATIKAKVANISSDLRLSTSVLSREVLFSKLLTRISTVIPDGVNLTGLNINQDDSAIDLNATATDYHAATQLQANLTDPANQIFSSADLVNVNCTGSKSSTSTNPAYPCAVDINAEFSPTSQFLFIGSGDKK